MANHFTHTDEQTREDILRLRAMTPDERGVLFSQACVLAAKIARSRAESGLPPPEPAPWPESTWEMLRKAAANARARTTTSAD